jgi:hypothetical protein
MDLIRLTVHVVDREIAVSLIVPIEQESDLGTLGQDDPKWKTIS